MQENQARRLLNDLATFRATGGRVGAPESVVAYRWLTECFEPSIAAVPADLRGKREPAELFHEILEHRWFLSEAARRDVGMPAAVGSYVDEVLRHRPDEKARARHPTRIGVDERPARASGVEQAQDAGDRHVHPVGAVVQLVAQLVERLLQLAGRQQRSRARAAGPGRRASSIAPS